MKINDGMVLTQLGNGYVAVSSGEMTGFRGIVKLNKTGADIWRFIDEGLDESEIAQKLVDKYDNVDYELALQNTRYIIDVLEQKGIITE